MKSFASIAVLALGLLVVGFESTAQAQILPGRRPQPLPFRRPTQSPYLNLLRGGDPAANYYMGVRPERERRAADAALYQLEQDLFGRPAPEAPVGMEEPRLPTTGHPAHFMNYSHFYGSGFPATGGGGGGSAPQRGPRR